VQGGKLRIEVTGGDFTMVLPKDASATLEVIALSSKLQNQTGIDPIKISGDRTTLQMGAGKAQISVQVIKGQICLKTAG
jgi:hypothetical protein